LTAGRRSLNKKVWEAFPIVNNHTIALLLEVVN
jgi:hypothetical protein